MYAVQFSEDGEKFLTLIKIDTKDLAETLMKACAGYFSKHWRVRLADQASTDFNAVLPE